MKKYTQEFKDSAVGLIINGDNKVKDIARDLDIHHKTLHTWVTNYKKEHNLPIRNINNSSKLSITEQEELKRLRKENKLLKQERDILKKATAYFAKETL